VHQNYLRENYSPSCVKYEKIRCTDGLGALDFCRTEVPALIVIDIAMPEVDGLSACKLLKSEGVQAMADRIMDTLNKLNVKHTSSIFEQFTVSIGYILAFF
jgi:CheY-like chemotaxis protein